MRYLKLLIILMVMVFGVVFAYLNGEQVTLNYHYGTFAIPLPLLVLVSAFLGALLGWIASLGSVVRSKRECASLRRQAKLASEEIKNLRTIPLKDQ